MGKTTACTALFIIIAYSDKNSLDVSKSESSRLS